MISVHSLTKVFQDRKRGQIRAVDDVSFSCQPGQIYGLLGANGAGKTTVMRLLATLLRPTGGSAMVAGYSVTEAPDAVRAHVGFLAALTARETLAYFGALQGMDAGAIAARTDTLARGLGMTDFLDRRVGTFSTGMKQKTSIARTLVHDPSVIILDEPTLGLDVMAARAILRFVRDCRDRGKTVIYSTHVMPEVERLCDRVGIIHGGRLLAEGTVAELRQRAGKTDLEDVFVALTGAEKEEAA
jgi:sodium transport system ATP-binding protein